MTQLKGTPLLLDVMLRPIGRGIQVVFAAVFTAAFLMMEWWAVLPLPAAFAVIAYELFFWVRGDRACRIRLGESLQFHDPIRKQSIVIEPSSIAYVRLHYRKSDLDGFAVAAVIAREDGVCFALQLDEVVTFEPREHDIDTDTMDAVLGGCGGMVRALAHRDAVCRQTVADPKGALVEWLRSQAPAAAWRRIALRGWRGTEPELDLFGYHVGEPELWCTVDEKQICTVDDDNRSVHQMTTLACRAGMRQAVLFRPHERGELDPQGIPLLYLALGDLEFAVPAPSLPRVKHNMKRMMGLFICMFLMGRRWSGTCVLRFRPINGLRSYGMRSWIRGWQPGRCRSRSRDA